MHYTRLRDTPLWNDAVALYGEQHRYYHNTDHIRAMYKTAARLGFDYDYALDVAILCHDVIYDDQPDKEARSASWAYEKIVEHGMKWDGRIETLILSTINHVVGRNRDNRLIILDLYELANPMKRIVKYRKILEESKAVYGCTAEQFAKANMVFMANLAQNFTPEKTNGLGYHDFWDRVMEGCSYSVNESARILDRGC